MNCNMYIKYIYIGWDLSFVLYIYIYITIILFSSLYLHFLLNTFDTHFTIHTSHIHFTHTQGSLPKSLIFLSLPTLSPFFRTIFLFIHHLYLPQKKHIKQ
ncbi:hypothetical protein J3Q64DRAFT_1815661 [Phycomyces blakesleeanus]|uniref:Uncharacterized protein n=1 Tax=Phycomyces blakesleeanus TaxID=4837 RepID=A0ABR3AN07_PHYBL